MTNRDKYLKKINKIIVDHSEGGTCPNEKCGFESSDADVKEVMLSLKRIRQVITNIKKAPQFAARGRKEEGREPMQAHHKALEEWENQFISQFEYLMITFFIRNI